MQDVPVGLTQCPWRTGMLFKHSIDGVRLRLNPSYLGSESLSLNKSGAAYRGE